MPRSPERFLDIHATGLVLSGRGVLIMGPPGAGKSLLALELLEHWAGSPGETGLVGDDRIAIVAASGGLTMRGVPGFAGRIELRGYGIVSRPAVASAPVELLVELVEDLIRLPDPESRQGELLGVQVPRCAVPRRGVVDSAHQMLLVDEALRALALHIPEIRQKMT